MPFRPIGLERDRRARRLDSGVEDRAPLALASVAAKPVVGARQLPRRREIARVCGERLPPEIGGAPRAREVAAVGVQPVGLGR